MCPVAVRCKSLGNIKAWSTTGYDVQHAACNDSAEHLRRDVGRELAGRETTTSPKPDRNRWVEMATRDMADGECHGQHRQTERERNTEQTNADVRKCRSKNCAPAPAKNKPERPEKLRAILFHFFLLSTTVTNCRSIFSSYSKDKEKLSAS